MREHAALVAVLLGAAVAVVDAQVSLIDPRSASVAVSYRRWSFDTPVETDSLQVRAVSQVAIPVGTSVSPIRDWRLDVSTVFASGTVSLVGPSGQDERVLLSGLSDTRLRLTGRLMDERLLVTLGATVPTGVTKLSPSEASATRVLGAPALRLTAPVLGNGAGATVGLVYLTPIGRSALGIGASYERRGTYTPLEAALAGGGRVTAEFEPADAYHLSLGIDGLMGGGRLSILVVADAYGEDRLTSGGDDAGGTSDATWSYQLGPTFTAHAEYVFSRARLRELRFTAREHFRSRYRDAGGESVAGSSGHSGDVGVTAVIGPARGAGIVLGLEGMLDSGMEVDNSLATAAMTAASVTIGLELLLQRVAVRPFVQGIAGRADAGTSASRASGFSAGLVLRTDW